MTKQEEKSAAAHQTIHSSRHIIRSFAAKANANRTFSEKCADFLTVHFGSTTFLLLNALFFGFWIIFNIELIPGITAFDPYPFSFLTMVVSLEAIVLAIVVLISQNRAAKIADVREEIALQVDVITEQEITKLMELVVRMAQQQGVDVSNDAVLQEMLKPTNINRIERSLERQIGSQT